MADMLSPGVQIKEIDKSQVPVSVTGSTGAYVGIFNWGPVQEKRFIDNVSKLANVFGTPNNVNADWYFIPAQFLSYSDKLSVLRAGSDVSMTSAVAGDTPDVEADSTILNRDDYEVKAGSISSNNNFVAKYPGSYGNSLQVSFVNSQEAYSSEVNLRDDSDFDNSNSVLKIQPGSNVATVQFTHNNPAPSTDSSAQIDAVRERFSVGDIITLKSANGSITQQLEIVNVGGISLEVDGSNETTGDGSFEITFNNKLRIPTNVETSVINRKWKYSSNVSYKDGTLSLVVIDRDGVFQNAPGSILETFDSLDSSTWKKTLEDSEYIWAGQTFPSVSDSAVNYQFAGGTDIDPSHYIAEVIDGWTKYSERNDTIAFVISGPENDDGQLAAFLISDVAEKRRDCIAFINSPKNIVVNNHGKEAEDLVSFRNGLTSSSFAVIVSAYKYVFDAFNNVYRYIPMSGDMAGLCARTDAQREPWFSPAFYNRGLIANAVKISWSPNKAEQDLLYVNGINPVINEPNFGAVLNGDKTMLSTPSAFDRINVRRLFIYVAAAVENYIKSFLGEMNDAVTRNLVKNQVDPFLRDIQGRGGIIEYSVVCDETNNTDQVVNSNRLVVTIGIRPARSINFITVNLVADDTGVEISIN